MRSITLTLDLDDPTTKLILLSLAADAKIPEKELPDKVAYLTEALGTENPEKPKKAAKKAPEKEPVVLPETEEVKAEPETAKEQGPTKIDVRAAGLRLSKAGKSAKVTEILKKYGADNLSTLKEESYADVIAELEAVAV